MKATSEKSSKAAKGNAKPVAQDASKPAKAGAGVKSAAVAAGKPAKPPIAKEKPARTAAAATSAKAPAKAAAPVAAKPAVKPAPAKVAAAAKPVKAEPAAQVAKAATAAKAAPARAPVSVAAPVKAPVPSTRLMPPVASGVALRAGRPSSRLAQLTVPSMAQSIASTAAKASYSQSVPTTVIVPALPSAIKKDAKLANNWKTKPVAELTDAELLAMSDDDYMNEVQLAAFRLKLQGLKLAILNSAGETTEHLREDTSVVPDPADRATIEEEHALELRTRDRERKLLKKIEQSIARIDAGDYGYCDETGEPIGVGRLLARPTATLSLEAQQRRELKQKMFGD